MMNRNTTLPEYDSLSDPHMADYWARKFGWTTTALPAPPTKHRAKSASSGKAAAAKGLGPEGLYKVTVRTGAKSNPSSASQKFISLTGKKGTSPRALLAAPGVHFKARETDVFQVTLPDVGAVSQIHLANDCKKKTDAWYVESVSISREKAGKVKTWFFPCNAWLSAFHGDKKLERSFMVREDGTGDGKDTFEIEVHTGDKRGAGTDANVYITLFGDKAESTRMKLNNRENNFERSKIDVFPVETPPLGKLSKVRIEHDNSGLAPGWYLDKIVITNKKSSDKFFFICDGWLAKDEGDGAIVRDLVEATAKDTGPTQYVVEVFTGNCRNAGTDANVTVILFGEKGDSGPRVLDNHKNNFERGRKDVFSVSCPDLGKLNRLRVSHDNSGLGPGWFLDKVVVTNSKTSDAYTFNCNRWLDRKEDDGAISRELTIDEKGSWGTITYRVHVRTGDVRNAGTSANVFCILHGSIGSSGRIALENSKENFSRGRSDIFNLQCSELGELQRIDLGHDNHGLAAGWFLDSVDVEAPTQGKIYKAIAQRWLDVREGDGSIECTLLFDPANVQVMEKKSVWLCSVTTSDVRFAGTNANVSIAVYGAKGKSDDISLRSKSDDFETGHTDSFKLELPSLGALYKLRVWHDNKGLASAWHLDHIDLVHTESGAKYTFPCQRWLATNQDDHQILRELPATGPLVKDVPALFNYKVHVFTGHKRGAGTDANVYLNVFGTHGDTGVRALDRSETHMNKFETGKEDIFNVSAVDLGDLTKIRIGHDNSGAGASWFLDKVVVVDPRDGQSKEFPCRKWLSRSEDDGKIERELPVLGAHGITAKTTTYNISVTTGDVKYAGTDANVSMIIFGSSGDTGELVLADSASFKDKFERGHTDIFKIEAMDIGDIKRIKVWHDGKKAGSGWYLDKVVIDVPSVGKMYSFKCNRWLATNEDDGLIERELLPGAHTLTKYDKAGSYLVKIWTSDLRGAGTDANVSILLYGKDKEGKHLKTEELFLRNKSDNFERNAMDEFKVECTNVGRIYKMRIGHDGKGLLAAWHLSHVEIHSLQDNYIYFFEADRWFSKSAGDKQLHAELPVTKLEHLDDKGVRKPVALEEGHTLVSYTVEVTTGDKRGAGSDANVFCQIFGTEGDSGERPLKHSKTHTNKWERGHTDVFEVDAVNLGDLKKVKIWHDNAGAGPAWFLDNVKVRENKTGKEFAFPCNRWLAKDEDDGLIVRELGVQSDLPAELATKAITTTYNVEVHTSDIRGAGTDANVFIRLYGAKDDTGDVPLVQSSTHRNKFERGQVDKFVVTAIDIGPLQKIKIGHDGKGAGAGWHLAKVLIDAPLEGKKYAFPCNRWFDKGEDDGELERFLFPEAESLEEYKAKVPWEVVVHTSDVKGAGTDANVFMDVYGRDKDGNDLSSHHDFETAVKSCFERGQEDRFNIELDNIGEPFKVRIGHDNKGLGAAWHLDRVVLINQLTKEAYEFVCQQWLSKSDGDKKCVRELPVSKKLGLNKAGTGAVRKKTLTLTLKSYLVKVYTGDVKGAGTDANVFVTMYGTNGDSGELKLDKSTTHRNKFERAQTDEFEINGLVDLGDLDRLRIWHDNKGLGASWFLDKVEVIAKEDNKTWLFPCHRWLSKDEDDKQISRDLPVHADPAQAKVRASTLQAQAEAAEQEAANASGDEAEAAKERARKLRREANKAVSSEARAQAGPGARLISYELKITTGDVPYAGTKAQVYVELMGHASPSKTKETSAASPTKARTSRFSFGRKKSRDMDDAASHEGELEGEASAVSAAAVAAEDDSTGSPRSGKGRERSSSSPSPSPSLSKKKRDSTRSPTKFGAAAGGTKEGSDDLGAPTSTGKLTLPSTDESFQRGRVDVFTLQAVDVGRVDHLRIGHNDDGPGAGWYLQSVEVTVPETGATYFFPCSSWLASDEGDKQIERVLKTATSTEGAESPKVPYELEFHTGDVRNAGTDANVFVVLYGDKGKTEELRPRNASNNFERNMMDRFKFDLEDLGILSKIRVGHDNKGRHPGWYLHEIIVRNLRTSEETLFPCDRWLAKDEDDGQIVRELTAKAGEGVGRGTLTLKEKAYKVHVVTGDEDGAGTNANVFVTLFGVQGDSGEIKLAKSETHSDKFERGQTDVFSVGCLDLGQLTKVRIRHDNKGFGASWFLDRVIITEDDTQSRYEFPCGRWLSKDKEDKQIMRELVCGGADVKARSSSYKVTIATADKDGAATDSSVVLVITGDERESQELLLMNEGGKHFARGATDEFAFEDVPVLGAIKSVRLWLTLQGKRKEVDSWLPKELRITELRSGLEYKFENKKPITGEPVTLKQSKRSSEGDFVKAAELKPVLYEVSVKTSTVKGAGTDANVSVILYGEHGDTGERKLESSKTHKNKFESGQVDVFDIEAVDLGALKKLKIWHDNKGFGAAWHLADVTVKNGASGEVTVFPCNKWLSKSDDDGQINRDLFPEKA